LRNLPKIPPPEKLAVKFARVKHQDEGQTFHTGFGAIVGRIDRTARTDWSPAKFATNLLILDQLPETLGTATARLTGSRAGYEHPRRVGF
jgi:hypothetical protein